MPREAPVTTATGALTAGPPRSLAAALRHGGVAQGADLVGGQRAVRRAEGEPEGQRLLARHPPARRGRGRTAPPTPGSRRPRPAGPPRRRRPAPTPRRPGRRRCGPPGRSTASTPARASPVAATRTSTSSSPATVRAGSSSAETTLGCSSPAWPTTVPSARASSAHRPGCHGAGPRRRDRRSSPSARPTASAHATASAASALPGRAPGTGRLQLTGSGVCRVARLRGHRGEDGGQGRVVGRDSMPGTGARTGVREPLSHQPELVDGDVARARGRRCAAGCPAACRGPRCASAAPPRTAGWTSARTARRRRPRRSRAGRTARVRRTGS